MLHLIIIDRGEFWTVDERQCTGDTLSFSLLLLPLPPAFFLPFLSPELYFVLEWIRWSFFILHAALASGVSSSKEIGGEEEVEHLSHAEVNLLKWWDLVREEVENPRLHSRAALQSHFHCYFFLLSSPSLLSPACSLAALPHPSFLTVEVKSLELNSGDKTK